jgi:O-antigen ligase
MGTTGKRTVNLNKIIELIFTLYVISLFLFGENGSLIWVTHIMFFSFSCLVVLKIIILRRVCLRHYFWLPLLFLVLCFLSVFWSINSVVAFSKSITLTQIFILYVLIYHAFYDVKGQEVIVRALFIAGCCLTIYAYWYYGLFNVFYALIHQIRIGNEISQINVFGMSVAATIVLAVFYSFYKKNRLCLIIIPFSFILLMATGTRKGIVFVALGLFLLIFMRYGIRQIYKTILISILLILSILLLLRMPIFSLMNERIQGIAASFTGGEVDASAATRAEFVEFGFHWFLEKPIIGYGIDNYRELLLDANGLYTYSHNNFIEILCSIGIIGFAVYYAIYANLLMKLTQKMKKQDTYSKIAWILIFLSLILDYGAVTYFDKNLWIYFALGFLSIDQRQNRQKQLSVENHEN